MDKSEKFWNKLSKSYDKQAKDKTYKQILESVRKYIKKTDFVLDFACATGLYSLELADNVKEIHAFDISSKMIDIAIRKARISKIDNIHFSQTTLFDDKHRIKSYDTVLALNILLYFKNIEKVTERISDLLKPGGFIITSTACLGEKRTLIGILSSSIIFILTKIRFLPYLRFLKMNELEKILLKSGFTITETKILRDNPATEYFIVARKDDKQ